MSILRICLLVSVFLQGILANPTFTIRFISSEQDFPDEISFVLGNSVPIPYSTHISHPLGMADPQNACNPITNPFGLFGMSSFILVARAGSCSYATKTKNAQIAGAKVLIIVHDQDGELPQSFDDGSDIEGITIPLVLIGKDQGEKLIKMIEKFNFPPKNPDDIVPIATINFPEEVITDSVKLVFWFSASQIAASQDFLDVISHYVLDSPEIFKFTPHFVTWKCAVCERVAYEVALSDDCISGGRYCSPNLENEGSLSGVETVYEDLRQACIWRNNQETWWKYVASYANKCLSGARQGTSEDCSYELLAQVTNIGEIEEIKKCVEESFIAKNGVVDQKICDNRILAAERELQTQYDITSFPILYMNNKPYVEKLDENIGLEICSKLENPPNVCNNSSEPELGPIPENTEGPSDVVDPSSEPKEDTQEKTEDPEEEDSSEVSEEKPEDTEEEDSSEVIEEKPEDTQEEDSSEVIEPKTKDPEEGGSSEFIDERTEDNQEEDDRDNRFGENVENAKEILALFVLFFGCGCVL